MVDSERLGDDWRDLPQRILTLRGWPTLGDGAKREATPVAPVPVKPSASLVEWGNRIGLARGRTC